jgi:hypothetical protein
VDPWRAYLFVFAGLFPMKLFVKELCHLDLHRGLEAHEMDARPHVWGTIDDERCTWKMKDVSFGGTLASPKDEIVPSPT